MPTAFAGHDELDARRRSRPRPCAGRARRGSTAPLRWTPGSRGRGRRDAGADDGRGAARAPAARLRRGAHVAELAPDETATVIVEVRSITSRPVRRRGMKPLVEAVVSDATGVMKATFFNQPWLKDQYRPGTRLMLAGKLPGRATASASTRHARTDAVGDARARPRPSTPPPRASPRRRSSRMVREHRAAVARRRRAAARGPARRRAPARPAGCAGRRALRRPRGAAARGWPSTSCCVDQIVQLRLRAERRADAGGRAAARRSPR